MTDYFVLLNEPRRPWLDADGLKVKFLSLSGTVHPDRCHNAGDTEKAEASRHYAELNAAYQCLADPKSRLRHLLELELGMKPKDVQEIPAVLADLFANVASACQNTDFFLAEKRNASSPLLQVKLFERGQKCVEGLSDLQKKVNGLSEKLTQELKSVDGKWLAANPAEHAELLPSLEELYRWFSYFNRWNDQIQERIVQLSL